MEEAFIHTKSLTSFISGQDPRLWLSPQAHSLFRSLSQFAWWIWCSSPGWFSSCWWQQIKEHCHQYSRSQGGRREGGMGRPDKVKLGPGCSRVMRSGLSHRCLPCLEGLSALSISLSPCRVTQSDEPGLGVQETGGPFCRVAVGRWAGPFAG